MAAQRVTYRKFVCTLIYKELRVTIFWRFKWIEKKWRIFCIHLRCYDRAITLKRILINDRRMAMADANVCDDQDYINGSKTLIKNLINFSCNSLPSDLDFADYHTRKQITWLNRTRVRYKVGYGISFLCYEIRMTQIICE